MSAVRPRYTQILSALLPASALLLPVFDLCMSRGGLRFLKGRFWDWVQNLKAARSCPEAAHCDKLPWPGGAGSHGKSWKVSRSSWLTWETEQLEGFVFTFGVVLSLGAIWGVVVLIPSLQLQLLAFLAFTNYRALLLPSAALISLNPDRTERLKSQET